MSQTNTSSSLGIKPKEVDPSWLCLRRVGNLNSDVYDNGDKTELWVRSLSTDTHEVVEEKIRTDAVVGTVFHRFEALKRDRIKVVSHLPFAPAA